MRRRTCLWLVGGLRLGQLAIALSLQDVLDEDAMLKVSGSYRLKPRGLQERCYDSAEADGQCAVKALKTAEDAVSRLKPARLLACRRLRGSQLNARDLCFHS